MTLPQTFLTTSALLCSAVGIVLVLNKQVTGINLFNAYTYTVRSLVSTLA